jgi:hypothetical protein
MIDSTNVKAYQAGSSLVVQKDGGGRMIEQTKDALNSKLHFIAEATSGPVLPFTPEVDVATPFPETGHWKRAALRRKTGVTPTGVLGRLGFVPFFDRTSKRRQRKAPTGPTVQKCKLLGEHRDILSVQDKLIAPALVIGFGIIFHDTPTPKDFTIPGDDVASCPIERVSALHPLIVACEIYWVGQVHTMQHK